MKKIIILILIIAGSLNLSGQKSLNILEFNINEYPVISADFFILDANGKSVYNYTQADFRIFNNGLQTPASNLSIPQQNPSSNQSFLIAFDLANMNFNQSKTFASRFIDAMDNEISEASVIAFDKNNYLESDYTTDKIQLNNAISGLTRKSGSFYDAGLIKSPVGALHYIDQAQYKSTILIVSDNAADLDYQAALDLATQKNARIFVVSVGRNLPQNIKDLCSATDGMFFENVQTNEFTKVAGTIINYSFGYTPMRVTWNTLLSCNDTTEIEIYVPKDDVSDAFIFSRTLENKPYFQRFPDELGFKLINNITELEVIISAKNSDIFVTSTTIEDPRFEIIAGNITNETIRENEDRTLRIRFNATDSAIVFTRLIIESDACSGEEVFITGGYPNVPPVERTIDIIKPACGETLIVGQDATVEWVGLLREDIVQLEISYNNGQTWDTLARNIRGVVHDWTVPDRPTDSALIRLIQLWPNNVGRTVDLPHAQQVNSAFFNAEGSLVITASDDRTAAVWSANTGDKLMTLRGHELPVLYAKFDPTEKYAVTASRDQTAILWDLSTGEPIHILRGHTGAVKSACFHNSGERVATSSVDGTVKIWNVETGELINNIPISTSHTVEFACHHPINNRILTASSDGWVREYYTLTGELLNSYNTGAVAASHCVYNYNGTKFAVTSEAFKTVQVWDIASGTKLFEVSHNVDQTTNYVIKSSSFHYNDRIGEVLLTSADDKTARLWEAVSGNPMPPHIFSEHINTVNTAVFDFDASRVLTASADGFAKIWRLDDESRALQIDTTCFAIGFAIAEARDLDLGPVVVGSALDTTINNYLVNLTKFNYTVSSVRLSGGDIDDFKILDNPYSPFVLDTSAPKSIQLRFAPKLLGERKTNLIIDVPGNTYTYELRGTGIDDELTLQNYFIEFGEVTVGDFKDTSFTVFLSNRSSGNIIINSVALNGIDASNFNVLAGSVEDYNLSAGATLPLSLRFRPNREGIFYSKLAYTHTGSESPHIISLVGYGVNPLWDTLTIAVQPTSAPSGSIVEIPIIATKISQKGIPENISGIRTNIKFNSTMLEPLFEYNKSSIYDSERTVEFDIPFSDAISNNTTLITLPFKVGLGNDTLTNITLMHSIPIGKGKLSIFEEQSIFALTDFCTDGGVRLIDTDGRLSLSQNKPNPSANSTTIEYEIIEPGNTSLLITDVLGNVVMNVFESELSPGKYLVHLELSELPNGIYYFILTTPTHRLIRNMSIIR